MTNLPTWAQALPLLAMALLGTSCSDEIEGAAAQRRAAARWRSQAPSEYVFRYTWNCFCLEESTDPVRVVVRNGEVVSARFADGRDAGVRGHTIDALHERLAEWIARDPDEVRATYDPRWGYPSHARVDFVEREADDELGLSVTCFAASELDSACPL